MHTKPKEDFFENLISKAKNILTGNDKRNGSTPGSPGEGDESPTGSAEEPHAYVTYARTEGTVRLKTGALFSRWEELSSVLQGGFFTCYSPSIEDTASGSPLHQIKLAGSSLRADGLLGFTLIASPDKHSKAFQFRCRTHYERNEWLLAFSSVKGLFRHLSDYYQVGPVIGEGATCRVRECVSKLDGQRYALKSRIDTKDLDSNRSMHNELKMLQIIATSYHEGLPYLHDFFFDKSGDIEVVTELMTGGELFEWIVMREVFSEDDAREIFRQVVDAVRHLHTLGIAHRDLKPENILFKEKQPAPEDKNGAGDAHGEGNRHSKDEQGHGRANGHPPAADGAHVHQNHQGSHMGSHAHSLDSHGSRCSMGDSGHPHDGHPAVCRLQVKLVDYDLAKCCYGSHWEGSTPCGTLSYMAPEIISNKRYSQSVDMWSLGVILYVLLSGRKPFAADTDAERKRRILRADYRFPDKYFGAVSEEAKDLIKALLQRDPLRRPSTDVVLTHPWVLGTTAAARASPGEGSDAMEDIESATATRVDGATGEITRETMGSEEMPTSPKTPTREAARAAVSLSSPPAEPHLHLPPAAAQPPPPPAQVVAALAAAVTAGASPKVAFSAGSGHALPPRTSGGEGLVGQTPPRAPRNPLATVATLKSSMSADDLQRVKSWSQRRLAPIVPARLGAAAAAAQRRAGGTGDAGPTDDEDEAAPGDPADHQPPVHTTADNLHNAYREFREYNATRQRLRDLVTDTEHPVTSGEFAERGAEASDEDAEEEGGRERSGRRGKADAGGRPKAAAPAVGKSRFGPGPGPVTSVAAAGVAAGASPIQSPGGSALLPPAGPTHARKPSEGAGGVRRGAAGAAIEPIREHEEDAGDREGSSPKSRHQGAGPRSSISRDHKVEEKLQGLRVQLQYGTDLSQGPVEARQRSFMESGGPPDGVFDAATQGAAPDADLRAAAAPAAVRSTPNTTGMTGTTGPAARTPPKVIVQGSTDASWSGASGGGGSGLGTSHADGSLDGPDSFLKSPKAEWLDRKLVTNEREEYLEGKTGNWHRRGKSWAVP